MPLAETTQPPAYLLKTDVTPLSGATRWRLSLSRAGSDETMEASCEETSLSREEAHLLAVIRGLEALDQPSQVTLLTSSRYVYRGLWEGLDEWRANGWTWESYGRMVPIKHQDLWQRLARLLQFHKVTCRYRGKPAVLDVPPLMDESHLVRRVEIDGRQLRLDAPHTSAAACRPSAVRDESPDQTYSAPCPATADEMSCPQTSMLRRRLRRGVRTALFQVTRWTSSMASV